MFWLGLYVPISRSRSICVHTISTPHATLFRSSMSTCHRRSLPQRKGLTTWEIRLFPPWNEHFCEPIRTPVPARFQPIMHQASPSSRLRLNRFSFRRPWEWFVGVSISGIRMSYVSLSAANAHELEESITFYLCLLSTQPSPNFRYGWFLGQCWRCSLAFADDQNVIGQN